MRGDLNRILSASLAAADPERAVRGSLSARGRAVVVSGERFEAQRVFVLAVGKAAGAMARAAAEVLGDLSVEGLVVTKDGHRGGPETFRTLYAAHPEPDKRGVEAARKVEEVVRGLGEGDLLVALVSGGASALLADGRPPVGLDDLKQLTGALLRSGASISEINAVRKHVCTLKGGGLARLASPARTFALLLSDVVGDDVSSIASGLTAPDPTTLSDARSVLERYEINPPENVEKVLREVEETPKVGDPVFERVKNVVCGSGRGSVEAAAGEARRLGYEPLILSTSVTGDCRGAAAMYAAVVREVLESGNPLPAPCAVVSGGEATVTVRGEGAGGPNQEFCLALAVELEDVEGWAAFSVDTDGADGPTDAAGGLVDGATARKVREAGVDPREALARNDSRVALESAGSLLVTGPTGTNVNDLRVALVRGDAEE